MKAFRCLRPDIVAIRARIVVYAAEFCQLFLSFRLFLSSVPFFFSIDVCAHATSSHAAHLSANNFFPLYTQAHDLAITVHYLLKYHSYQSAINYPFT